MTQPANPPRPVAQAVAVVLLAALATYASCALPVFYDQLRDHFHIDDALYGLMFSIGSLGGLLTALAGGVLVDRHGPRRVVRWCLAGIALSMALMAACGSLWPLMAAAIGVGALFQTACYIAVNAYLVRAFPASKRRMLALSSVAVNAMGILFPLAAEGLLHLTRAAPAVSFSLVLHVPFALLAAVLAAGSILLRSSDGRAGDSAQPSPRPWAWSDVRLPARTLALVALAALHATVDNTLYLWMPAYLLSGAFPEKTVAPGGVLSAYAAAYLVSRAALMLIRENTGRRAFLILPGLLGGAVMIAGLLSHNYTATALGYVLGGLLWSVEFPIILTLIADESGPRFGTAGAMVSLGMAAGTFLMINLTGRLVTHLGDPSMWIAMLIPALGFPAFALGAALWLYLYRDRSR